MTTQQKSEHTQQAIDSSQQTNLSTIQPQMQFKNSFIPSIGHPLQTNWAFWYLQRQQRDTYHNQKDANSQQNQKVLASKNKMTYKERLKQLGQISTIEQFFNYYVYMKKPSEMPREIDLYFFRENEIPMWEDSPNGGIWILKVKKEDNVDKMWESLLFALIGEHFEEPKVIGLGLSLRTKERLIEVWVKDGRNENVKNNISYGLRKTLGLDPEYTTLYYKDHQKSIKDQSTMKNAEGFKFVKVSNDPSEYKNQKEESPRFNHGYKNKNNGSNQQTGNSNGLFYRKKQKPDEQMPYANLAANSSENQHRVYRAKAPSNI